MKKSITKISIFSILIIISLIVLIIVPFIGNKTTDDTIKEIEYPTWLRSEFYTDATLEERVSEGYGQLPEELPSREDALAAEDPNKFLLESFSSTWCLLEDHFNKGFVTEDNYYDEIDDPLIDGEYESMVFNNKDENLTFTNLGSINNSIIRSNKIVLEGVSEDGGLTIDNSLLILSYDTLDDFIENDVYESLEINNSIIIFTKINQPGSFDERIEISNSIILGDFLDDYDFTIDENHLISNSMYDTLDNVYFDDGRLRLNDWLDTLHP